MTRNHSNNKRDINELKEKLSTYKHTLEAMKAGTVIDDYLLTKEMSLETLKQFSLLKGEVKMLTENQEVKKAEYEQQLDHISKKVDSLNVSLQHVKEEVALVLSHIKSIDINHLQIKMDKLIEFQNTFLSSIEEGKNQLASLKVEMTQIKTKEQIPDTFNLKQNNQPTSYKQLNDMLKMSKDIQFSTNEQGMRDSPNKYYSRPQQLKQQNWQAMSNNGWQIKYSSKHVNHVSEQQFNEETQTTKLIHPSLSDEKEKINQFEDSLIKQRSDEVKQKIESSEMIQDQEVMNKNVNNTSTKPEDIETIDSLANQHFASTQSKQELHETSRKEIIESSHSTPQQPSNQGGSQKEAEEKLSFLSFLQFNKYFGK